MDSGLPDSIITNLLKLSWKYNLKNDKKIGKLLAMRKYKREVTFDELQKVFKNRTYKF
jgi:hypothetical protein